MSFRDEVRLYFSDFFEVRSATVQKYGAFDISLVSDLPLFIDPFLLFNSKKPKYQSLHHDIVRYLLFLRDKSAIQRLDEGLIKAWYRFPEIKQTWLGFSASGNTGRGLGNRFGQALYKNLNAVFSTFGEEEITKGTHLEKLCLVEDGVGKDFISDFTTNLIQRYLLEYTQNFARKYIKRSFCRTVAVRKVRFNYKTETWEQGAYYLPFHNDTYVLLCPRDILTKDDTWINRTDLIEGFEQIPEAIPNDELRAQINNYFKGLLPRKPKKEDETRAARETIIRYPELIDYFIKYKEENGDQARSISEWRVDYCRKVYLEQFRDLALLLSTRTGFYHVGKDTYEEAKIRIEYSLSANVNETLTRQ